MYVHGPRRLEGCLPSRIVSAVQASGVAGSKAVDDFLPGAAKSEGGLRGALPVSTPRDAQKVVLADARITFPDPPEQGLSGAMLGHGLLSHACCGVGASQRCLGREKARFFGGSRGRKARKQGERRKRRGELQRLSPMGAGAVGPSRRCQTALSGRGHLRSERAATGVCCLRQPRASAS